MIYQPKKNETIYTMKRKKTAMSSFYE